VLDFCLLCVALYPLSVGSVSLSCSCPLVLLPYYFRPSPCSIVLVLLCLSCSCPVCLIFLSSFYICFFSSACVFLYFLLPCTFSCFCVSCVRLFVVLSSGSLIIVLLGSLTHFVCNRVCSCRCLGLVFFLFLLSCDLSRCTSCFPVSSGILSWLRYLLAVRLHHSWIGSTSSSPSRSLYLVWSGTSLLSFISVFSYRFLSAVTVSLLSVYLSRVLFYFTVFALRGLILLCPALCAWWSCCLFPLSCTEYVCVL